MGRSIYIKHICFWLGLAISWPVYSGAQEATPFPEFTFKRVKIPPAGSIGRINIQIDPIEQAARLKVPEAVPEEPEAEEPPAASAGAASWFWDQISPARTQAGAKRMEQAVIHLAAAGQSNGLQQPRLQSMQSLAERYGKDILLATVGTRVSPAFVLAIIGVESGGQTDAVSSAGAQGLMQLIPATAERFGVRDPKNAADNIRGGVAYLDWLMKEFNEDPIIVLAAYNAGENAIKQRDGVPDFPETRKYVPKVLAAWSVARGLCITPPELVSDGCVFTQRRNQ